MPRQKKADQPRNRVAEYDKALIAFAEAADVLEQAKQTGDLSSVERSALELRAARSSNGATQAQTKEVPRT